jgi:hypothetical protein
LEQIGKAAATEHGQRALQFMFGQDYVKYMSRLGSKSNSTVFLGNDVGDLSNVLAKGLGLFNSNAFQNSPKTTHQEEEAPTPSEIDDGSNYYYNPTAATMPSAAPSSSSASVEGGGKYDDAISELEKELREFGSIEHDRRKD